MPGRLKDRKILGVSVEGGVPVYRYAGGMVDIRKIHRQKDDHGSLLGVLGPAGSDPTLELIGAREQALALPLESFAFAPHATPCLL